MMWLLQFAQWVQDTWWATGIRESWYVYPVILSTHLAAIGITGGMLLVSDLRLLGVMLRKRPMGSVVGRLLLPKRIGLTVVIFCGVLLVSSKAEEYYYNWFFWTKMGLLGLAAIHAVAFHSSVYANTAELDKLKQLPGRAKLAGALSLLIWIGIACAGRGIGYIDPPLGKLHAKAQAAQGAGRALVQLEFRDSTDRPDPGAPGSLRGPARD
jgi:uncharacterized membrane protein